MGSCICKGNGVCKRDTSLGSWDFVFCCQIGFFGYLDEWHQQFNIVHNSVYAYLFPIKRELVPDLEYPERFVF